MTRLRRPSNAMMLAVNAAIDGQEAEVDRLVRENKLNKSELRTRVERRGGQKYELNGAKSRPASRRSTSVSTNATLPEITITGRTPVRQLFRLIEQADSIRARAQQELKRRKPEDIEPVKQALAEIEVLRRKREQLEEEIREAEDSLG